MVSGKTYKSLVLVASGLLIILYNWHFYKSVQFTFNILLFHVFTFDSDEFPSERVPSLEEAVETCVTLGLQMYIDVKTWKNSAKVTWHNLIFEAGECDYAPLHSTKLIILNNNNPLIMKKLCHWGYFHRSYTNKDFSK